MTSVRGLEAVDGGIGPPAPGNSGEDLVDGALHLAAVERQLAEAAIAHDLLPTVPSSAFGEGVGEAACKGRRKTGARPRPGRCTASCPSGSGTGRASTGVVGRNKRLVQPRRRGRAHDRGVEDMRADGRFPGDLRRRPVLPVGEVGQGGARPGRHQLGADGDRDEQVAVGGGAVGAGRPDNPLRRHAAKAPQ